MLTSKAVAIVDPDIKKFIQSYQWSIDRVISPNNFIKQHRSWLNNDVFNIGNLNSFAHAYITDGCTGAFNDVYNQSCYVLEGEYTYHRDSNRAVVVASYNQIPANSRLIISYPFAATGSMHQQWPEILEYCRANNINIFVDACLSGVSKGSLDLCDPITHVAFSFSKAFGTGFARTGVLYTNADTASPASITNRYLYIQHNNAYLHMLLMNNFTSDYIYKKYHQKQIQICKEHNLAQSDCVLFGIGEVGRLSVTKLICNN